MSTKSQDNYRAKNRVLLNEKNRLYRLANKSKCAALVNSWRSRNPDYKPPTNFDKLNPAKARVRKSRYEHKKAALVHPDCVHELVESFYEAARKLTAETGVVHVVDHIIPIAKGGFHHHLNLQVLPASINCSKQDNPFWYHPSYLCWSEVPCFLWPETLSQHYEKLLAS